MEEYSYSKLIRFEECPLAYMRKYLNQEKQESNGITECGIFMHSIMEKYEKNELQINDLLKYYEDNFDKNVLSNTTLYFSKTYSKDLYALYYQGFRDYLINFTDELNLKNNIDVEKEFHIVYNDDYSLTGKIDLVFRNKKGELCILDHKSKSKFKSSKEKEQYARQLYIYAWAAHEIYGEYPKYLIFNMLRGNPVCIEFNENDMNKTLEWVNKTVEDIRSTIVYNAIKDTFYCMNWCCLGKCDLCSEE